MYNGIIIIKCGCNVVSSFLSDVAYPRGKKVVESYLATFNFLYILLNFKLLTLHLHILSVMYKYFFIEIILNNTRDNLKLQRTARSSRHRHSQSLNKPRGRLSTYTYKQLPRLFENFLTYLYISGKGCTLHSLSLMLLRTNYTTQLSCK